MQSTHLPCGAEPGLVLSVGMGLREQGYGLGPQGVPSPQGDRGVHSPPNNPALFTPQVASKMGNWLRLRAVGWRAGLRVIGVC